MRNAKSAYSAERNIGAHLPKGCHLRSKLFTEHKYDGIFACFILEDGVDLEFYPVIYSVKAYLNVSARVKAFCFLFAYRNYIVPFVVICNLADARLNGDNLHIYQLLKLRRRHFKHGFLVHQTLKAVHLGNKVPCFRAGNCFSGICADFILQLTAFGTENSNSVLELVLLAGYNGLFVDGEQQALLRRRKRGKIFAVKRLRIVRNGRTDLGIYELHCSVKLRGTSARFPEQAYLLFEFLHSYHLVNGVCGSVCICNRSVFEDTLSILVNIAYASAVVLAIDKRFAAHGNSMDMECFAYGILRCYFRMIGVIKESVSLIACIKYEKRRHNHRQQPYHFSFHCSSKNPLILSKTA